MEHKVAANILISMLDKHQFDDEEKKAILIAIGILAWTSLSQGRVKALKAKRNKNIT